MTATRATTGAGAGAVRVRLLPESDALLVAALVLQAARARGATREPGFLDRFATVWRHAADTHPCLVAEHGGEHAGFALGSVATGLAAPGAPLLAPRLLVDDVFVVPGAGAAVHAALAEAFARHARRLGATPGPFPAWPGAREHEG